MKQGSGKERLGPKGQCVQVGGRERFSAVVGWDTGEVTQGDVWVPREAEDTAGEAAGQ